MTVIALEMLQYTHDHFHHNFIVPIRNKYCSDHVLTSIQINLGSFSQVNDVV